jgi:hypothetical protein
MSNNNTNNGNNRRINNDNINFKQQQQHQTQRQQRADRGHVRLADPAANQPRRLVLDSAPTTGSSVGDMNSGGS